MINDQKKEIVHYDVAVLGGGPGGMAAAVSAARQGAKVVLVERLGYLGGQMASGLPFLAFLDMHKRQVVGGLAQKMVDDLAALDGTAGHRYCPFHLSTTTVNPFYSRIVSFQWAKDYGIDLLMHCEVTATTVEDNTLTAVTVTGKGHDIEIRAKVFIDATGDGDVAYMAGAEYEKGQEGSGVLQPPSLMFNLGGVNFDKFSDFIAAHPEELPYHMGLTHVREGYDADFFRNNPGHIFFGLNHMIEKLRKEGKCPINRDTVIYIRLPMPGHVAVNTIRIQNFDGSDVHDLSRGEQEAHLQILPLINMLQQNVPGFEDCYMTSVNAVIGVRESRRIMGLRKLTGQDCIDGKVPEDTIALYSYFIDIHNGAGEGTYTKTIEEPYGVPYGCAVAKSMDGLMMAGRCMSVDAVAFGSTRIMTLCMAVGEAAGIGAALAVQKGKQPRDIDPQEVRELLRGYGAILEV